MAKFAKHTAEQQLNSPSRQLYAKRKRSGRWRRPLLWLTSAGAIAGSIIGLVVFMETAVASMNWLVDEFFVGLAYIFASFFIIAGVLSLVYKVLYGRLRPRKTLLWLRRFHLTDKRQFPIDKVIRDSRYYVIAPHTIRDPRMAAEKSASSTPGLALKMLRWFIVVISVLFAIAIFIIWALMEFVAWDPEIAAIVAGYFAIATIVWFVAGLIVKRTGFDSLPRKPEAAVKDLDTYYERAKRGRHATGAVRIFKAHDDNWQDVVARAIERSDLILIDVTQLTENIEWEIKSVFAAKDPEAIILAMQAEPNSDVVEPIKLARLEEIIGPEAFSRVEKVIYPALKKHKTHRHSVHAVTDDMREAILNALDKRDGKSLSLV